MRAYESTNSLKLMKMLSFVGNFLCFSFAQRSWGCSTCMPLVVFETRWRWVNAFFRRHWTRKDPHTPAPCLSMKYMLYWKYWASCSSTHMHMLHLTLANALYTTYTVRKYAFRGVQEARVSSYALTIEQPNEMIKSTTPLLDQNCSVSKVVTIREISGTLEILVKAS